jgi:hypothetical protein
MKALNLTTPRGVVAHMGDSLSEQDWEKRCNEVVQANGGEYPLFWHIVVVQSGLREDTRQRWIALSN